MTRIRVTCDLGCGDKELTERDVTVRINIDTQDGVYLFVCPSCGVLLEKHASSRTIDLLASGGCRTVAYSAPKERLVEPIRSQLTHDVLMDVHDFLADDDLFYAAIQDLINNEEGNIQ